MNSPTNSESPSLRDIPVLTEALETLTNASATLNTRDTSSAIASATLKLADSLLHQAARDIEAILFEQVFDRLRAELPELIERILAEQTQAEADRRLPT